MVGNTTVLARPPSAFRQQRLPSSRVHPSALAPWTPAMMLARATRLRHPGPVAQAAMGLGVCAEGPTHLTLSVQAARARSWASAPGKCLAMISFNRSTRSSLLNVKWPLPFLNQASEKYSVTAPHSRRSIASDTVR